MLRFVLWAILACLAVPQAAVADDKKLQDFFGEWVGGGTAKEGGATTQDRASTVMIDRLGDGFKVTWSTMRSQVDAPSASVVKSSSLKFKGTATPNVFHAIDNADPLKGGRSAWAILKGATLKIQQFNVEADGAWNVQIYDRTLTSPTTMDVAFRRITNGEVARKAELKLTKSP